ncbi:IS5 family transposase [Kitasatospora sp. NPDC059673]|uniref:IS5 family transposase n=1 Tax=Kitasatospora sp. NPDC059673 TaxID=3346901 RepID=UPI0036C59035
MSDDLVPDDLWERVAPPLPPRPPRRHRCPGRLPADDRAALRGIVYVLRKGVSRRDVPAERVGCSGVTAWRRLRDLAEAGVWPRLHEVLLAELRAAGLLEMDDAAIDGSHVRALKRGAHTGPSPVDRARPGSKHHVLVDAQGIPLAVSLTGGNRNDVTQLLPLLAKIPLAAGLVGRPRHRPDVLLADRGYDHDNYRRLAWKRGVKPVIARRGVPHGSRLGVHRWVVEHTIAWLHGFRRLRIRRERRDDIQARPQADAGTVGGAEAQPGR